VRSVSRIVCGVLIRPAISVERQALEALQLRASMGNEGDREALLRHPDAIEIPLAQIQAGGVFVLEENGAVAGFCAIVPREDGDTELEALFVEPASQRRGIGKRLVEYSAGIARSKGSTTLHVVGNPHAEQFYLACGFAIIGRFETRFGPGLLMRLPL
jgi:GNAT superfamily N-acetyltransferase